jgi:alcohol dehydrogenase (cytochrome c)
MTQRVAPLLLAASVILLGSACGRSDDRQAGTERRAAPAAPAAQFPAVSREHLIADAAGDNWLVYGGSYNNQRFSTLGQIDRGNVHELVPVWIYQAGVEAFATTPIVAGNTMYITTPESHVVALNAATGERLWEYRPQLRPVPLCCGPNNRGAAIWGDKVYVGTLDARLVALHNRTGQVVWERPLVDSAAVSQGYSVTMAPLAYDGKVFIGVSGGKFGIRGFAAAYDAQTGDEVWRWHTIPAPDERGRGWWGEFRDIDPFGTPLNRDIAQERDDVPGYPNAWQLGGGAVWMTPAYDPASGLLYFGVGNPAPGLTGAVRPGDNLYTGSIVALDGAEGTLRWYFQYVPHDVWDLSPGSPPFLFEDGGRLRVGHAGKTGWMYVVDAGTGEPLLRSDNFVPQENLFAQPTAEGIRMAPGSNGGAGWSPVAFSPRTGLAYVLGVHQPMVLQTDYRPLSRGEMWLGGTFRFVPGEEHWGTFTALDVGTGEIRWQHRVPRPMLGAALATAGDVVFVGQGDGTFDAFDARNGELLWQFNTTAGVHGGPVTYMVDGVQYVAVAAGGNRLLDTPRGDDLYVFALADRRPGHRQRAYDQPQYARSGPLRPGAVRQLSREPTPPAAQDTAQPPGASATTGPALTRPGTTPAQPAPATPARPPTAQPPTAQPPTAQPPAAQPAQPPAAEPAPAPPPETPRPPARRPRILGDPVD